MLVAGLLAGGCSDGDPATPVAARPSSAPSSATPASPTPTRPPTQTPTASQARPTPASAAAFVRAYYAAVNKAAVTGKDVSLRNHVYARCAVCTNYQQSVSDSAAEHHHLGSAPFVISRMTAHPITNGMGLVRMRISAPAIAILDDGGRRVGTVPSRRTYMGSIALEWLAGTWKITSIKEIP